MALVGLQDATLTVGGKRLFAGISLQIDERDRIGLAGPNGSGKTSLLRVLAGELELDQGAVQKKRGIRLGHLPQFFAPEGGQTLLELVLGSIPGRDELHAEIADLETEMSRLTRTGAVASGSAEAAWLELSARLADRHERLAQFEADYAEHVALRILAGLGFHPDDSHRDLGELSGGWRMRGVLAALLFMQPDLLLMDEPTNHLDMPSVAWLASFLKRYRRAFILISHDREFLNEQVTRVLSFEPEGLRSYRGDYERYLVQRAEERAVLENRAKNVKREREKAEAFIERFRAQATKAKAVQSRIKALARMEEVQTLDAHQGVRFTFPPTTRTSKQVLRVAGLEKRFGDNIVLSDVDLSVIHGEKIGVIGVNGAGKTTLLKILAGEIKEDAGEIQLGHHVTIGHYAQDHGAVLDPANTAFAEVARAAPGTSPTVVRTLLGSLLITGDNVEKRVAVLSGGERARVALARLLLSPRNFILMDEPTTHLDLSSSEQLAEALTTFDGTLIFVSHNRAFVRRLATRIWNVADGTVETYPGTLDEYMESAVRRLELPDGGNRALTRSRGSGGAAAEEKRSRTGDKERRRREAEERVLRREVLGPLQTKVTALEAEIAELERLQDERSTLLVDPDVYQDSDTFADLSRSYQTDAARLEKLTAEWESASVELEELAATCA